VIYFIEIVHIVMKKKGVPMDELVRLVSEKTGLPPEKAKVAVEVVLKFLKEKLPAPIAGQLEALLSGGGSAQGVMKNLGGLLGN
jgi:uncharacterized protein (DUF2267 family)